MNIQLCQVFTLFSIPCPFPENVTHNQDYAPSSRILERETSDKNEYQLMEVAYHINSDGRINLTSGWKEFVAESGIEDRDVVMVIFFEKMTP